jgi:pyruvyl transferase EpsI
MRQAFPACQVGLVPDAVLFLDLGPSAPRDLPLLVCLRQDLEARISSGRRAAILEALCHSVPGAVVADTAVPGPRLDFPAYEKHLDSLWADFARARCVVTDRLHGLIFAVISRTPCVVIENNSHKIRSTCETWLAGSPSIRLLTAPTPAAVEAAVEQVSGAVTSPTELKGAFAPLTDALHR